jgi:hypothetical protein
MSRRVGSLIAPFLDTDGRNGTIRGFGWAVIHIAWLSLADSIYAHVRTNVLSNRVVEMALFSDRVAERERHGIVLPQCREIDLQLLPLGMGHLAGTQEKQEVSQCRNH